MKLPLALLLLILGTLIGCATLPKTTEGQGIVVLPFAFQNDTALTDPIRSYTLRLSDGTLTEVPGGNNYLILVRPGPLTIVEVRSEVNSTNPSQRVSGDASSQAVKIPLEVRPGTITIAPVSFRMTQGVQGDNGRRLNTGWAFVPLDPGVRRTIVERLMKDPNFSVWTLD